MFEVDCDDEYDCTGHGRTARQPAVHRRRRHDIDVSASAVYLDFEAPMAPHFMPNPNGRQDGWVNLTVDFLGEYKDEEGKKDGWLVYNDDNADDGVGGYLPQLRVSTAVPSVVGGALAAGVVEGVPALPPGGTKANAVCAVVTAMDLLGNESKLPRPTRSAEPCVTTAGYQTMADDEGEGTTPRDSGPGWILCRPRSNSRLPARRQDDDELKELPGAGGGRRDGLPRASLACTP